MDALSEVLRRLLASIPDVPEAVRDDIAKATEREALLELFQRRAEETLRSAQEHHRALEALIRRS